MDMNRVFRAGEESICLEQWEPKGWVLDVGGGGEGIIGLMHKDRVVAIDLHKPEFEGAPSGPLKIIMDARDLKFLDSTFDDVTAFFCFMYMKDEDLPKAFSEIHRVMKQGGDFRVWDLTLRLRKDTE